ncbi:uncharacterized protein LOC110462612 [Mizuhopecten yessoensis]|uniref:Baculoviral IAP repeat-containing protein 7-A n=1 Tax=Mizuhopecten yessoensis TaxID=6573 RepID=A0A210PXY1_MIZYE|nr:uncharacterized protein LOC110462612 [Mizuhopecten yessoensis]XP_021372321.1 uncharacterized protein LOC110462612 [Mizuhopecten yessoensis]XP_021372322.1 uncharacterized protein LOC110462612 [Mizuhopecten yessoensis]XP_021372323.1 uncharacterized protein LOC110462612 [Mizuhopecten yessoensis]XP_021372325.1 uncharacterized protein LOC110462612 [Mizuhopecten yessoensis]OWF41341.1 Baculoviral IAP repeat-containing protein 7-A [Mizuhopecten yessoensis]
MAVPIPPYNAENPTEVYPSHEMVDVNETLSWIQEEEVCTVQVESSVGDLNVVSSYNRNQKRSPLFASTKRKKLKKKDQHKPKTKKSSPQKKLMTYLRGRKSKQEIKRLPKNAGSEDTADPDEIEQYDRRSSLPVEIDNMVTQDHTIVVPVENKDVMTNSYGDSQCFTDEDDSFRDVHFSADVYLADMNFSSLLDDWSRQYEGVSKTVEADGLGSEMNDIEDDDCQKTIVKKVTSCKQSATILSALPKAEALKSSNAIQCTEDAMDYTAVTKAGVESQELKSSKKSHYKDETIDYDTKRPVLMKLSHTVPFPSFRESNSLGVSSDQRKGSIKLDSDDPVGSLDPSEIMDIDDLDDKLECHTMKTETGQYPHFTTPILNTVSFDEFVFQKEKSESNFKNVTNQSHVSPHLFSATSSSCICSRCEYSSTVGHCLSVEEPKKSTPLYAKPEKWHPQELSSVSPNLIWAFFIYGLVSCWSDLKQMGKLDEESCKKVSAMFQHHTDKESEGKNNKPKKWNTDTKQKENNKSQLKNDGNQGGLNSSDVVEPLQSWRSVTPVVNTKPFVNQSNLTKHTGNNNIHQQHPAISSGNLSMYQPHTRHTVSDQVSSVHRKRKLAIRKKDNQRYHCIRHTVKPFLSRSLLHHSKLKTSRRLVKRMNSLEKFTFQQSSDWKTIKHDKGRFKYLHIMPDVRSELNVFMLPFNHPNSHSAAAVNGTSGTDHEQENSNELIGATARRLHDMENPPSTFNEQISVFEQIITGTVTESMKFEWARFKSFWSFPMSCPISPTVLAKYGFYYTGNEDKVCCFCCGVIHGDWQKGQSVYAMHYQISRRCRFMRGENVGNVPIHGSFSSLSRRGGGEESEQTAEEMELTAMLQTPDSITSILLGRERDAGNPIATASLAQALPTVPSVRTEMRNGLGAGGTSNPPTSQTSGASSSSVSQALSPQPVTPVSTPNPTPAVTQPGQASAHQQISTAPQTSTVSQAASNVTTKTESQAQSDTVANQQRPANQQHPTTLAQRQHQRHQEQQQQPGQQQPLGTGNGAANNPANLGVTTAKPRYPNYAVLTVRSSTFNGFPNHLDQTPVQMARAGFFYAGYGDYVRCFFCGGGLRNWEPGDDPWVEHARWFPRCAYVKQNKGQTFINLVLQRQRELTLPNEYINTTTGASSANQSVTTQTARITDNQTSTGSTPPVTGPNTTSNPRQAGPTDNQRHSQTPPIVTDEEMKSPAVLSIKEMGYSDEVIKTAIQHLRRNRGPVQISAELLVETIFGFGDEDLPPQRPDQTQTSNVPATAQTNTNPPKDETPPSEGAVSTQPDPGPPRRLRDRDSSTRAYTEEELKSIQEENSQLKEQMKCKICMDNVVCISFLPCGHLCCCAECAPAMVKCPICRQIIRGSVKTYLS